jgi:putative protease
MKMTYITYIETLSQLEELLKNAAFLKNQQELILGTSTLSRYSETSLEELLSIKALALKNNLIITLEWDTLNQEEKFLKACEVIDRLPLHDFKAIRLQDPGAVEYIKNKYPWLKIQLILENGNHNLVGLTKWCEYLGPQCERLVLSNELSRETLREYAQVLTTPLEVLTLGRILLFYTPRKLLSPIEKKTLETQSLEAYATSEESPHSGFPLIENLHGTFMFNVKDLYLLDHLSELSELGIHHARVDWRFDETFSHYHHELLTFFKGELKESELTLKSRPIRPFIKGFYNINKTDVLFTKLKNKRTQRLDPFYIGEIVDVERDCQLALMIKGNVFDLSSPSEIKMITPEGKVKMVSLNTVKSSTGEIVSVALKNDLVLIPYVNGVTVKTQVYFQ